MAVCCDLTKLHEKTLYGSPSEVLAALEANEKTEKGEYCVVIDLHKVPREKKQEPDISISTEARLVEIMKQGISLREAQDRLILDGVKKNAVKQAAINLKKWFNAN